MAQKIYAQGHGDKGAVKLSPVAAVVDALDEVFYATFQKVELCNKPVLLALDVSDSTEASMIMGSCISAREASAAMALITAATEPECEIIAFSAPSRGGYGGKHGGGEPHDRSMLDVMRFDTTVPAVMVDFVRFLTVGYNANDSRTPTGNKADGGESFRLFNFETNYVNPTKHKTKHGERL